MDIAIKNFFYRFDIAHAKGKVIVVVKGDLPTKEEMPSSLYNYIQTNTYLQSSDPNFFKKLRRVLLPKNYKKRKNNQTTSAQQMQSMNSNV